MSFEAVIGVEVHAQLRTRTKIFCGCPVEFGRPPNTLVCPVCLGHPGALPMPNRAAVELAVTGALALGCDVQPVSVFARKNYFYPDLPKGYQITQYERPLATGGGVAIEIDGVERIVPLIRLHLEEDAGKSIHDGLADSDRASYVDLNRAGTPLVEIVSEPRIRSPREAASFLERLRSILRYAEVCDGNMEQGSLRCDANVSLRPAGTTALGTRTELKNLNSFRHVERALEYEIERQSRLLAAGGTVEQQTLLWDAGAGVTRPMRGKEEEDDYRYFPDPDLPVLRLAPAWIEECRRRLPELPHRRKRRFRQDLGLGETEAHQLTLERPVAEFFEAVVRLGAQPRNVANWVIHDLRRVQNAAGLDETEIRLEPRHLAELIGLVAEGTVSATAARQDLLPEVFATGRPPREIAAARGLVQVSDDARLLEPCRQVIAAHPEQVAQYRAGKTGVLGFLVGRVMKATAGAANPQRVNELLRGLLDGD